MSKGIAVAGGPAGHASGVRRTRWVGLSSQEGFSLIELFVVCLIIGVLCAIAIPQFLSQANKGRDASAKELARTSETTAESIAADNEGSYEKVTVQELSRVEPGIHTEAGKSEAYLKSSTHGPAEYSLTTVGTDGIELTISRNAQGAITRTCKSATSQCSGGATGSW